jgi:hypothetical protein
VRQFRILTLHFFHRLFQNDMVDFEDEMKERTIAVLSVLSIISLLLSFSLLSHYGWIKDVGQSWVEKTVMAGFFMLILGFFAVIEWDSLVVDRRDFLNLRPLPLRVRTLLAAKFAGLCLFVGMFAIGLNALSAPLFALYLANWKSSNPLFGLKYGLIHLLVMFLACFFAFFFNVVLTGVLKAVLGPGLFRRLSSLVRSGLLIIYFGVLFLFFSAIFQGAGSVMFFKNLAADQGFMHNFQTYFPAFWFVDLYETLLGNKGLAFHGTWKWAIFGLAALVFTFILTTGLTYRRFLKNMGQSRVRGRAWPRLKNAVVRLFDGIFLRNLTQRAVFHFYTLTLRGSVYHKMRVAAFTAVGVGVALIQILTQDLIGVPLTGISWAIVSIPFSMTIFLLVGLRDAVNLPLSLPANWIFRQTERRQIRHYFSGLRKGVLVYNLLPLFFGLFVFYAFLWGGLPALYHVSFSFAVAVLMMEAAFFRWCKIPFACSYLPGKERVHLFWLGYLALYLLVVNGLTWMDMKFLLAHAGFLYFFGGMLVFITALRIYQVRFFYKGISIQYEEEPPPIMVDLSYRTPAHKRGAMT